MRLIGFDTEHEKLIGLARAEWPNECCGLLGGYRVHDELRIVRVVPLINEVASPIAFRSDPMSLLTASRSIEADGLEIIAIYHSHPSSEPIPSRYDRRDHCYPQTASVIIGRVNLLWSIRAWWPDEDWRETEFTIG